jgi:hypothetical protein
MGPKIEERSQKPQHVLGKKKKKKEEICLGTNQTLFQVLLQNIYNRTIKRFDRKEME